MQGKSGSSAPAVSLECPVTCLCHRSPGPSLCKGSAPHHSLLPGAPTTQSSICSWPTLYLRSSIPKQPINLKHLCEKCIKKAVVGRKKKEPPYTPRFRNA